MHSRSPRRAPRALMPRWLPVSVAVWLAALVTPAAAALPPALDAALQRSGLPADSVSLLVVPVARGAPLAALNEARARNPASAIKVATTWVALDLLGPSHRWRTEIYALGQVDDGVLDGDLLIRGTGDPFLVIEAFWKLLGDLRRKGVRHVRGDLLIDDSLFDPGDVDPGAFDGQPHRLYNVAPAALLPNFKSIRFVFNPAADGSVAVRTEPPLANLRIASKVKLTDRRCRGNAPRVVMRTGKRSPDAVVFSGELPRGCRDYALTRTAMTARSYTYGLFKALWSQWGGRIDGGYRAAQVPDGARPLLVWRSEPLAYALRPLNKWSNNTMSRSLLLSIGATGSAPPVRPADGARVALAHLAARGLPTAGVHLVNGSGLAREVRATARFFVDLLRHAWRQPTMPEFVASLSLAGRDGTTRKRYARRPFAGRMHLKTGWLKSVLAVTGYVHANDGRRYALALVINHRRAHGRGALGLRDAVLDWTFDRRGALAGRGS